MHDIHDITPPVQVGFDPAMIKYALIGCGIILLIAVVFIVLKHFIKKKNMKENNVLFLPPPLPADVAALKELDSIQDLMEKYPRMFCFKISGVFKTYIGKQFKMNAPEMTTEELIMNLRNLDLDKENLTDARQFLLSLDDIKYAGLSPSMDKMKNDSNFVRNFVKSTAKERLNNKTLDKRDTV